MRPEPFRKDTSKNSSPKDEQESRVPAVSANGEEKRSRAKSGQPADPGGSSPVSGNEQAAADAQLSKSLEIELEISSDRDAQSAPETTISILSGIDETFVGPEPPEHLLNIDWLEYEYKVASDALNAVLLEVRRLETRKDKKYIHSTRVAFRRWYAVWKVLKKDGWQRPDAKKKGFKELKKAYRLLGAVRDWDMTINLARKAQVPEPIVKQWLKERGEVRKNSNKRLEKLALRKLVKKMKRFLDKRYLELRVEAIRNESLKPESAYKHIDRFLKEREVKTRDLADDAHTLPQLHSIRLSVKSWRYILVEFFGVSSSVLVDTQQTLGQINDIDRFVQVLEKELNARAEKSREDHDKPDTTDSDQLNRLAEVAQQLVQLSGQQQSNEQSSRPASAPASTEQNNVVADPSKNVSENDDTELQTILEETVGRRNSLIAGFLEKGHDALPYGFRPGVWHRQRQTLAERARSI